MLSDEWLSRYGLLENFNASVTRTGTGTGTGTHTGTGTWTTGVTAIALCTSCSRAKNYFDNSDNLTSCCIWCLMTAFIIILYPGKSLITASSVNVVSILHRLFFYVPTCDLLLPKKRDLKHITITCPYKIQRFFFFSVKIENFSSFFFFFFFFG